MPRPPICLAWKVHQSLCPLTSATWTVTFPRPIFGYGLICGSAAAVPEPKNRTAGTAAPATAAPSAEVINFLRLWVVFMMLLFFGRGPRWADLQRMAGSRGIGHE